MNLESHLLVMCGVIIFSLTNMFCTISNVFTLLLINLMHPY